VVVRFAPKARLGLNAPLTRTRQRMQTWPLQNTVKTQTTPKSQKVAKERVSNGPAKTVVETRLGKDWI